MTIQAEDARAIVARAITTIVPDADVTGVSDAANLRQTFELDSLDFLSFVELVGQASGVRIDEKDYPELATMATSEKFLLRNAP